jgi:RHS repeat-associated protein
VVTDYEYTSESNIDREILTVDGQSFVLDYVYNSTGNLSNTIYPSGANVSYSPNALGQAKQVGSYATNALYHPNGMMKSHSYSNGFSHAATQKSNGLPNTFYDVKSGVYAINHGFSYDANNNLTTLDDKINNAYDLALTYDGLDRLDNINDSYLGAGYVNYDGMGNISAYKLGSKTISYHYNNTNKRLESTSGSSVYSFSYDDKGNVTYNGDRGFIYNSANQMVESGSNAYVYDGNNKRVKVIDSKGVSYSFYGSNGKLMYRQVDGQDVDYYYLGKKLVTRKKGSTINYLHADYLGSTAAESNTSGAVTERMHYQPFGESIETPKDDVGYTGHKFDTDLGLSYMQARYYDPVVGRFMSNDPIGFRDIHSFNRYAYANNNPYKYIDPNGESASAAFSGHIQLEQNKQMNHLKSKMSAGEFKQVEQDAKDIITGAAALIPGGQIFDVANIVEDIVEGGVPLADGSGLAAGEGASAASDAIDKDLSKKGGVNKIQNNLCGGRIRCW